MTKEEKGPRTKSLADMRVIIRDQQRDARKTVVYIIVTMVITTVIFGYIFTIVGYSLFIILFLVLVALYVTLAENWEKMKPDIRTLPFTFTEKLRLSLYSLKEDLQIYVDCGEDGRKRQAPEVRRRLIDAAYVISACRARLKPLDLFTEDLADLCDTVNDFLQRVNYKVKRNEPFYSVSVDALVSLANGLARRESATAAYEQFGRSAEWIAGQGSTLVDPEFAFAKRFRVGPKASAFFGRWSAEIFSAFAVLATGLIVVIGVQASREFLSLALDDNTALIVFVTVCCAVGSSVYIALKRFR